MAVESEIVNPGQEVAKRTRSPFWWIVAALTIAGLALRVEVGRRTIISFDEWQHVFMAAGARWSDVFFELRTNAHPPLFFGFLRWIARLGHVGLYRSISIGAGAGSIVAVGCIARRVLQSPVAQLLCVAAFALSADAIATSVEIRSYELAVFFTLVAFAAWLAMLRPVEPRAPAAFATAAVFAICSSLALLSHYSAVFFVAAALAVMALRGPARNFRMPAAAFALPCAVFAVAYFLHARRQPIEGYLYDFYRGFTPGETALGFLVRNTRNFFNLFSPVPLQSTAAFAGIVAVLCAAGVWALRKRRDWTPEAAGAVFFAVALVLEMAAGGLARKYPFGGLLRHQYIAGPFLLIAAFVPLDAICSKPGLSPVSRMLRRALPVLLSAAIAANLAAQWPKLIQYPGEVILQSEFNEWKTGFPHTRAVYLDHWGVIGYFAHTSDQPRTFVRRIADAARIDQYRLPDGTSIFYDKSRDNLDLLDPSVYRSFADCLRSGEIRELSLFFFRAGGVPLPQSPAEMEQLVAARAAQEGLTAIKVHATPTTVFAAFRFTTLTH